jgi:hypothetical protein
LGIEPIRPPAVPDFLSDLYPYTEKVWGIPCNMIGAQWAAQRIRGLSLRVAVMNMLFGRFKRDKKTVKTVIDEFEYPRLGAERSGRRFKTSSSGAAAPWGFTHMCGARSRQCL